MMEIRLARSDTVKDADGDPLKCGVWMMDTFKQRIHLETLATLGNERFGSGTHWVEERSRDPDSTARFQHSNLSGLSDFGVV